jgi:hypothetical protein
MTANPTTAAILVVFFFMGTCLSKNSDRTGDTADRSGVLAAVH